MQGEIIVFAFGFGLNLTLQKWGLSFTCGLFFSFISCQAWAWTFSIYILS